MTPFNTTSTSVLEKHTLYKKEQLYKFLTDKLQHMAYIPRCTPEVKQIFVQPFRPYILCNFSKAGTCILQVNTDIMFPTDHYVYNQLQLELTRDLLGPVLKSQLNISSGSERESPFDSSTLNTADIMVNQS